MEPNTRLRRYLAQARAWPDPDPAAALANLGGIAFFGAQWPEGAVAHDDPHAGEAVRLGPIAVCGHTGFQPRIAYARRHAVITHALATSTARQLADELRARRLSSRELLDAYLTRIERLGPPINAVVTLDRERAYAAAARADDDAARGDWLGPLHGLPITIKDAIEVAGVRSTGGATELTDHIPAVDAPSVARLKAAGAIVFGKTNVPRWSGDLQTFNDLFGTTNNPWSLDRIPGGSSGGPAAAVACGFTAFELGTDIGGSVRIPAHCCGVFGLKPSYGVISQRGYLDHVGGGRTDADINVFGPLARSADDLDLLLSVLAGPDSERALAWRLELPAPRRIAAGDFRVGIWLDDAACPVDRDQLAVMQQAVDRLADAGARGRGHTSAGELRRAGRGVQSSRGRSGLAQQAG